MSCCGSPPQLNASEPLVDLKDVIESVAWQYVDVSLRVLPWYQRIRPRRHLALDVNWNFIKTEHRLTDFRVEPSGKKQRDICLCRTEFRNESKEDQHHNFRTERQTTQTVEMSVQKGFTVGGKVDVKFALPTPQYAKNVEDACNVTGGISGELQWSKTNGEIKEETLIWSVDSQVKVPKGQTTVMSLMLMEETIVSRFTLRTRIRSLWPNGRIPVGVRRRATGTLLELLEIPLSEVCAQRPDVLRLDSKNNATIVVQTNGLCSAGYASNVYTQLKTYALGDGHALGNSVTSPVIVSFDDSDGDDERHVGKGNLPIVEEFEMTD